MTGLTVWPPAADSANKQTCYGSKRPYGDASWTRLLVAFRILFFLKVQAVHGAAMTGVQEPDPREQRGEPPEEDGEEEEEEEKVRVSVEAEEEEEEEKDELPYPSLAPVVLLALTQTSPPRSWCLRAVCHPYLWQAANSCTFVFIIRQRHCLFVFQLCTFSVVLYLRGTCHIVV